MNLKDRGITVGDLFLLLILIISTILIFYKFEDGNEQSYIDITEKVFPIIKKS